MLILEENKIKTISNGFLISMTLYKQLKILLI